MIRASRRDNSDVGFEEIDKILVERVLRALPQTEASGNTASLNNEGNAVCDRFVEMLAKHRREPDAKLDFFEAKFGPGHLWVVISVALLAVCLVLLMTLC